MAAEEAIGVDLNLFKAAGLALLVLAVFQVPAAELQNTNSFTPSETFRPNFTPRKPNQTKQN